MVVVCSRMLPGLRLSQITRFLSTKAASISGSKVRHLALVFVSLSLSKAHGNFVFNILSVFFCW